VRFGVTGDSEIEKSGILKDKYFDITNLKRCTVVTTIARFPYDGFKISSDCKLKDFEWDMIIFDEASMITLASIVYVLYKKPDCQFVVAGDPFQIQPIIVAEEWKGENIYTLVNLHRPDSFQSPQTKPHNFKIVNLPIQYRSIPPLGKLFSEFTYNGILKHNRGMQDKRHLNINGLGLKEINFIRFPVNKFESIYRSQRSESGSPYHIYSAIFTAEFAIFLKKEIIKVSKNNWKIGIICPYKAQATVVEKMIHAMQTNLSQQVEIIIDTIHGFQGDECDIIINLLNPPPNITENIFLNKQNILNVSISRAKDYLIFILPENIEGLTKIKRINSIIQENGLNPYSQELNACDVENIIFNQSNYIYENSFITTHQPVNVYSKPDKKYEVRCEENAIDVQLLTGIKKDE
jgi:superfamily I DNA and/or RNA helicase